MLPCHASATSQSTYPERPQAFRSLQRQSNFGSSTTRPSPGIPMANRAPCLSNMATTFSGWPARAGRQLDHNGDREGSATGANGGSRRKGKVSAARPSCKFSCGRFRFGDSAVFPVAGRFSSSKRPSTRRKSRRSKRASVHRRARLCGSMVMVTRGRASDSRRNLGVAGIVGDFLARGLCRHARTRGQRAGGTDGAGHRQRHCPQTYLDGCGSSAVWVNQSIASVWPLSYLTTRKQTVRKPPTPFWTLTAEGDQSVS